MALKPGSLDANGNFQDADTLAKFIDDALPNKSDFGQVERRQLLIAIAIGIINYLKVHGTDSFSISVSVDALSHEGSGRLTIS
jgi:hypothetical protein